MYGGFVTSSLVTTQLSGTTDNITNIGMGSSLIGVNISGYTQSSNEDFPLTWTGSFVGNDTSWLELSEGNQVPCTTNRCENEALKKSSIIHLIPTLPGFNFLKF